MVGDRARDDREEKKEVPVEMRRRITLLFAALTMALAMAFGGAGAALADKGGFQHEGSCGVGRAAHEAIEDQTSPGATEYARFPPSEAGCTGKG